MHGLEGGLHTNDTFDLIFFCGRSIIEGIVEQRPLGTNPIKVGSQEQ